MTRSYSHPDTRVGLNIFLGMLTSSEIEHFLKGCSELKTKFPLEIHIFETLDSTNDRMWQCLAQDFPSGTVVIALRQTAGRGQFQRTWQSQSGGLYLSLGLRLSLPGDEGIRLNFGSAWGVAMALRQRGVPIDLKWPNDLLLDDRKLGGILTETRIQGGQIRQAVIGLGINWCNPVPTIGIALQPYLEARNLQEQGRANTLTSLAELAAIVLQGLAYGYQTWCNLDTDLERLIPKYHDLLHTLGQWIPIDRIQMKVGDRSPKEKMGKVVGVTKTGALRVALGDREIRIPPGSIHLGYG